jgi:hypothetical protein
MEETFRDVVVNYKHRAEVVVHYRSRWQYMIPPSGYHNLGERHQRISKITYSSMRRYGKKKNVINEDTKLAQLYIMLRDCTLD